MTQNNEREAFESLMSIVLKSDDAYDYLAKYSTPEFLGQYVNGDVQKAWVKYLENTASPISQNEQQEAVAEVKMDCFGLKDIVWNAHHWAHILQVGDKLYKTPPNQSEEIERLKAENNTLNDAIIEDKIFIADYNRLKAQNEKMYQALKCIDEDLVNPVHYRLVKGAIVDYGRQQSL